MGKECEWREVLHGAKREFVVSMSVVLQQNYVCGGGGGLHREMAASRHHACSLHEDCSVPGIPKEPPELKGP